MSEQSPQMGPLDMSGANPELFAALAKAQQAAVTVGKDGHNQRAGYNYASAEAMIRGARAAMAECELAIISTWTTAPASISLGEKGAIGRQFSCATVTEHWAVTHSAGGYVQGRAQMEAIASGGRPYEKAVAATSSYMHGFVLRHVLNLDRAEEGEHAVDGRGDEDEEQQSEPQRQSPASDEWKAAFALFQPVAKRRADLIQEHKLSGYMTPPERVADVMGIAEAPNERLVVAKWWPHITKAFADDVADMEATVARGKAESGEEPEAAE